MVVNELNHLIGLHVYLLIADWLC